MENNNEEIKKMLAENLEQSKNILKCVKSTRKIMMFDQIMGVLKIVIIIVPLILGFLYLGPFIKKSMGIYSEIMGEQGINIENLLK
ncbi:hypothetical protein ACFL23_00285 [Patescibacteria group bacterium]